MTIVEVAKRFGMTRERVRQLIASGTLAAVRVPCPRSGGARWDVDEAQLASFKGRQRKRKGMKDGNKKV